MLPKALNSLTKEDLEYLVSAERREERTIEYKEELPGLLDKDKKEFLADVSSFANAAGGDLIYGIAANDGVPISIPGLSGFNEDKERLRLESMIRDGIDPRVPGVHLMVVPGFSNGPALVLHVPRSWAGPHMVTFKGTSRFFSRGSAGKFPMDVTELRSAFEAAGELPERIRRWRDERLGHIVAGEGPMAIASSECIVVHLVPLDSMANHWRFDANSLNTQVANLPPLGSVVRSQRFNVDGLLTLDPDHGSQNAHALAYAQLFRSGRIEAVNANPLDKTERGRFLASVWYEEKIIQDVTSYLRALSSLGVAPPIVFLLSILGADGAYMAVSPQYTVCAQHRIDRDVLVMPDVLIEEYESDLPAILRPAFDAVWNACGFAGSLNYDADGKWVGQR